MKIRVAFSGGLYGVHEDLMGTSGAPRGFKGYCEVSRDFSGIQGVLGDLRRASWRINDISKISERIQRVLSGVPGVRNASGGLRGMS